MMVTILWDEISNPIWVYPYSDPMGNQHGREKPYCIRYRAAVITTALPPAETASSTSGCSNWFTREWNRDTRSQQ